VELGFCHSLPEFAAGWLANVKSAPLKAVPGHMET
jgi:hypothetical protein